VFTLGTQATAAREVPINRSVRLPGQVGNRYRACLDRIPFSGTLGQVQTSSMVVTIGLTLDHALTHGSRIEVTTSSSRVFTSVTVAALDRFCIVLLDADAPGAQAHVVSRDSITSVSIDRSELLALERQGQGRTGHSPKTAADPMSVFGT
jgi:hypothetical protein